MIWLLILVVAPQVVFAVHRGRLMALKREKGWSSAIAGYTIADIRTADLPVYEIKGLWFLPALVFAAAPLVHGLITRTKIDTDLVVVYWTFIAITALFWLSYYIIYRQRAEAINEDIDLTLALTRVRRYNWSWFWLVAAWITGALNLCVWAAGNSETLIVIACLAYSAILIVVSLCTEFATRIAQQKLTAGGAGEVYLDDDDYWLFGLFYHNPNDRHFFVNDRIGMNMTVNLARPVGKVVMALALLCLVAMPFVGAWIWAEEKTPISLEVSGTAVTARHIREEYVIAISDVKEVELIDKLPRMRRTAGTGLDNLSKGRFHVTGYGASRLCLNPQNGPFLVIRADSLTYIFNDSVSGRTHEVYTELLRALSSG